MTTKSKGGIASLSRGRMGDVLKLDPRDIKVEEGFNARDFSIPENQEHVRALAASIRELGVEVPLLVRYDKATRSIFLVDGECRLRAAMMVQEGLSEDERAAFVVPAMTANQYASESDLVISMLVRNEGRALGPIEKGAAFFRLHTRLKMSEKEIAAKMGMTRARVVQLLELHAMPERVKDLARSGQVSATLAQETLKEHDGDEDAALAVLEAAVETAQSLGRTRATRKHIADPSTPDREADPSARGQHADPATDGDVIEPPAGGRAGASPGGTVARLPASGPLSLKDQRATLMELVERALSADAEERVFVREDYDRFRATIGMGAADDVA